MLSPYTVLDLTDDRGGLAGMVLGDLGAAVIKVEPPEGSPSRRMTPLLDDAPKPESSLRFFAYNRNKRGITLDLALMTAPWIHAKELPAVCSDTWGAEVRPNETPDVRQPWHIVVIPNMGLLVGEIFQLDDLAEDCARDGVYECFFVAPPLPITGAVGSPVNPQAIK